MDRDLAEKFDRLLEQVLAELPDNLKRLLEEVPLIVDDLPDPATMQRLGFAQPRWLCGLYSGIPLTRRSVQHSGTLPDRIQIYREGVICSAAGGGGRATEAGLKRQIRITVLHEMGHHFGLKEADLRKLGYQ